jgi:predicted enzyme involved in methoxymalonyl-ACP biosynthesis
MLLARQGIAEGMNATKLVGEYRATPKNAAVTDLYPRMRFSRREDGKFERLLGDRYRCRIKNLPPPLEGP